jgi:hypothetical protein
LTFTPARNARLLSASRPVVTAAALVAVLGGCTYFANNDVRSGASAGDIAACRKRADEIYARQNRGEIYLADMDAAGGRDAPYATSTVNGNTSAGLAGRFQREQFEDDCLRSTSNLSPPPGESAPNVQGGPATAPAARTAPATAPSPAPAPLPPGADLSVPPSLASPAR